MSSPAMTGKERLRAAIKGEPVDRPPIWLREGFNFGGAIEGEPLADVLGQGGESEFLLGWKSEARYRELFEYALPHVDVMWGWGVGEYLNRFLLIPPRYIKRTRSMPDPNTIVVKGRVETPKGNLTFTDRMLRNVNTYWHIEHLVADVADLKKLAEVPFDFDPSVLDGFVESYKNKHTALGNRGIMRIELPSPIVAISAAMSLENFLAMSITERDLFHQLLEEITRRELTVVDSLFQNYELDTIVNLGGSEQCTPPMMSPESFDEFVVPYDGTIIKRLKQYNIPVNMHCHGKVNHALKSMAAMGVDSSDPVEPPPQGDVTYEQARRITDGKLTIVGNLEFNELENESTDYIRRRVREILSLGKERLIMAASAGPISVVTPTIVDNYKAWIDTCLEMSS